MGQVPGLPRNLHYTHWREYQRGTSRIECKSRSRGPGQVPFYPPFTLIARLLDGVAPGSDKIIK